MGVYIEVDIFKILVGAPVILFMVFLVVFSIYGTFKWGCGSEVDSTGMAYDEW